MEALMRMDSPVGFDTGTSSLVSSTSGPVGRMRLESGAGGEQMNGSVATEKQGGGTAFFPWGGRWKTKRSPCARTSDRVISGTR